jgi:hypothetical protein
MPQESLLNQGIRIKKSFKRITLMGTIPCGSKIKLHKFHLFLQILERTKHQNINSHT